MVVQASPARQRTTAWERGARDDMRTRKSTTAVDDRLGDVAVPRRDPGECFLRSRDIRGPAHSRSGRANNGGKERTTRAGPGKLPWDAHLQSRISRIVEQERHTSGGDDLPAARRKEILHCIGKRLRTLAGTSIEATSGSRGRGHAGGTTAADGDGSKKLRIPPGNV